MTTDYTATTPEAAAKRREYMLKMAERAKRYGLNDALTQGIDKRAAAESEGK